MNPFKKTIDNLIIGNIISYWGSGRLLDFLVSRWPNHRLQTMVNKPNFSTKQARKKIERSPLPKFLPKLFWHNGLTFLRHPYTLRWFLGVTIVTTWGYWNGKLLLSTTVGVVVMVLVYRMQQWDWQVRWLEFWRYLTGSNRQLTLAVGCGAFATIAAYSSVSIWTDLENHWIASGMILQSLGLIGVIGLLIWLIISHKAGEQQAYLQVMLANLTDAEPLKRLIAVREITRWVANTNFSVNDPQKLSASFKKGDRQTKFNSNSRISRSLLIECFQMMLVRESEPTIYNAVIEALQALDSVPQKISKSQSFSVSIPLKNYHIHGE